MLLIKITLYFRIPRTKFLKKMAELAVESLEANLQLTWLRTREELFYIKRRESLKSYMGVDSIMGTILVRKIKFLGHIMEKEDSAIEKKCLQFLRDTNLKSNWLEYLKNKLLGNNKCVAIRMIEVTRNLQAEITDSLRHLPINVNDIGTINPRNIRKQLRVTSYNSEEHYLGKWNPYRKEQENKKRKIVTMEEDSSDEDDIEEIKSGSAVDDFDFSRREAFEGAAVIRSLFARVVTTTWGSGIEDPSAGSGTEGPSADGGGEGLPAVGGGEGLPAVGGAEGLPAGGAVEDLSASGGDQQ
ncbi:hypothetical protein ANN_22441 [Periplaneta americana]|uniref:Uncharacterized protein n=1 Tax=Periplaneta americana TaxID=6978 RepID=A0ABQ8S853_PERAM|nr:hypothetical protein ANN_22441 [Periplaneta americana]